MREDLPLGLLLRQGREGLERLAGHVPPVRGQVSPRTGDMVDLAVAVAVAGRWTATARRTSSRTTTASSSKRSKLMFLKHKLAPPSKAKKKILENIAFLVTTVSCVYSKDQ